MVFPVDFLPTDLVCLDHERSVVEQRETAIRVHSVGAIYGGQLRGQLTRT